MGSDRLRVGPWRGDPAIAYLAPDAGPPPDAAAIERCLSDLRRQRLPVGPHLGPEPGRAAAVPRRRLRGPRAPAPAAPPTSTGRAAPSRPRPGRRRRSAPAPRPVRRGRRRDRDAVLRGRPPGLRPVLALRPGRPRRRPQRHPVLAASGWPIDGRASSATPSPGGPGPSSYLQRLAVHPDDQRRGIGTALVVDALHWVRRRGARSMLVNTQEQNQPALVALRAPRVRPRARRARRARARPASTSSRRRDPRARRRVPVAALRARDRRRLARRSSRSSRSRPAARRRRGAEQTPALLLQSQSGWVAPDGTFQINVRVRVDPARLRARGHALPAGRPRRPQLDRTGRGESLPRHASTRSPCPLDQAPIVGGGVRPQLPDRRRRDGRRPTASRSAREGVYPLGSDRRRRPGRGGRRARSPTSSGCRTPTRAPSGPRSPSALVVPVSAPVAHQPDGPPSMRPASSRTPSNGSSPRSGRRPGVPVTLQPTPETVSAAVGGRSQQQHQGRGRGSPRPSRGRQVRRADPG